MWATCLTCGHWPGRLTFWSLFAMITPLSEALAERGFDTLTPVQEAVTAQDVGEADLLVSAQTGSGKTVGFGLAIATTLLGDEATFGPAGTPLGLVVAPTRELAFQVMQELRWLYAKTGAIVTACVGGMDARQERRLLERGTHLVVGTPGRLCDHIRRGALDLGDCRAVVLDEADEMLDLGFREDLEFILQSAPVERRTLLFSATVSPVIAKLAEQFQKDARRINTINKAEQHSDISYQALRVADRDVDHAIYNLLRFHEDQSAIVFANTRATVNHLTTRLANRGLPVVSLSGELSQSERSHALQAMRDGRARICVATDVAARGIDLPNLNLVVHAELPTNTESLLHRSGRTGRAGRKGISAIIVPPKMVGRTERLLKWAKLSAEWTVPPSAEDIRQRDEETLLNDPAWQEPLSEEQTAFAAKLLERYSAETVAAAVWRLHQARHSAPEELDSPDTPAPRREARPARDFGPSRWFSLSVGRANKAEARWLLPLILRATDIEKSAIGAIRVQDTETHVEVAEAQVAAFEAALGADGALEDGVHARLMDSAPAPSPRAPRAPDRGDRPSGKGGRADRKPQDRPQRDSKPRYEGKPPAAARPAPKPVARQAEDAPAAQPKPKPKPKAEAPQARRDAPKPKGAPRSGGKFDGDKPFGDRKPGGGKPGGGKPKSHTDKPRSDARPDKARSDARPDTPKGPKKARPGFNPNDPSASGKPRGTKRGKPGAMPRGGNAMPKRPR
jgi:ATP-dependent RNA helicase DeaD